MSVDVSTAITIDIDGQKIELTMDQAKYLVDRLSSITGQNMPKITYVPYDPYPIRWDYWYSDKTYPTYYQSDNDYKISVWTDGGLLSEAGENWGEPFPSS